MRICRLALTLASRHRNLIIIYVLVLSLAGYLMASSVGPQGAEGEFEEAVPTASVIDRDGSAVSRAIADRVAGMCEVVELEDSVSSLQDAAARDLASYVLVIPEGYGAALLDAAREGVDAPDMECVVSYANARGALVDERVRAYAQQLYDFAAAAGADAEGVSVDELVSWADEVQRERVEVTVVQTGQTTLPISYLVYCQFATYPLFGGVAAVVASGFASLRDGEMRRRLAASSVPEGSQARQVALAIAVTAVLVWAANAALGFVLFHKALAGVPLAFVGLPLLALLALSLVGAAFGFLLWQAGASPQVAHAASNIGTMVMTFLGGAWVSIDQMGEAVRMVGRLTPCYWTLDALTNVFKATEVTGELVATVLADVALVALFAVALGAVGLAVGKMAVAKVAAA